jgi:hypothetical protein
VAQNRSEPLGQARLITDVGKNRVFTQPLGIPKTQPKAAFDPRANREARFGRSVMTRDEEQRLQNKIRKALMTDEGMIHFLDDIFGSGNYSHDRHADVWVVVDQDYIGSGRGFVVIERGGDWFKAVIPPDVLQ